MSITIVSHSPIEIAAQGADPDARGARDPRVDATTSSTSRSSSRAATCPSRSDAILISSRGGIDTSGSTDAELCIQLIGQGPIRSPAPSSVFGPGSEACTGPPPRTTRSARTSRARARTGTSSRSIRMGTARSRTTTARSWSRSRTRRTTRPSTGRRTSAWTPSSSRAEPPATASMSTTRRGRRRPRTRASRRPAQNSISHISFCYDPPPPPGNIVVQKVVDPSTDTTKFTFDTSYGGLADFQLGHNESNNSGPLTPGTYSVSEVVPAGQGRRQRELLRQLAAERDPARFRRDGHLRLHEHEARKDHRRQGQGSRPTTRRASPSRSRAGRTRWPTRAST